MADLIAYTVVTKPGGVDGLDHTDKGGTIVFASFDKKLAEEYIGKKHSWYTLTPTIVDLTKAKASALAKLNKLDRLVLGI